MTLTIEAGRGRLMLNENADNCHVTLDVNGAGYSLMLTPKQMNELADALREMAWQMTWERV